MDQKDILVSAIFSDYLKPIQIVHDLKASDKVDAIEELLDVLAKLKLIRNRKVLLTRLIDRENLVSTALGEGIAVPHARWTREAKSPSPSAGLRPGSISKPSTRRKSG